MHSPHYHTIQRISFLPECRSFPLQGLIILFLLLGFSFSGKSQTRGTLTDAQTGHPVAFANIAFEDKLSGTVSNLKGEFIVPQTAGDSIFVSCIGYHSASFEIHKTENHLHFKLQPKTIELEAVNIYPGENPALLMMQKVFENSAVNNPDLNHDYSCIVYHKMTFSLDIADSIQIRDSLQQKFVDFNRDNHLLLMESVSEKKHKAPEKNHENVISGRVSGFKDPALSILPCQLQPFGFYEPHIRLMGIEHLNPISKQGLKHYLFLLQDTIIENGDSLFYITYQPRKNSNIKPLSGSFHIHKKTYGVRYLKARSNLVSQPYSIDISQSYKRVKQQWFPSELRSRLIIKSGEGFNSFPYPMIGEAKSLVTAVNLDAELAPGDFSSIVLEDNSSSDSSKVRVYRYEPLSAKDSSTYHLLDSLGKANKIDNILRLQKELIQGYISAGPFQIDLKHLIGYNQFEGLKLGAGLWTGPEITGQFSLGGYYTHAFKAKMDNYGGGIKWQPTPVSQTQVELIYSHDLQSTGAFNFHHGNVLDLNHQLRKYAVTLKDREEKLYASAATKLRGPFSGKVFFSKSSVTPVRLYPFLGETTNPEAVFESWETGIKLRWAHKEKMTRTAFGLFPEPSGGPKVWLNIIKGAEAQDGRQNNYTKLESRVEKSFRITPAAKTTLQLTSGIIDGWKHPTNLYSFFGTYEPVNVEVPGLFATMSPNEFAADRFLMATIDHRISLRQNRPGRFKPEINLTTKAGWGIVEQKTTLAVNTFEKGFYESGILFDNLMKVLFIKYGLGIHYRYGPYQKEEGMDNWSFRLSIDFSF